MVTKNEAITTTHYTSVRNTSLAPLRLMAATRDARRSQRWEVSGSDGAVGHCDNCDYPADEQRDDIHLSQGGG